MSPPTPTPVSGGRLDLNSMLVALLAIGVIGADGFISSHLCEKLMAGTPHSVLAVNHLVDPSPPNLAGRISFRCLDVKNDSRLEGLIKMSDLVWIVGEKVGEGIGRRRKEAHHQAAEISLRNLARDYGV